MGWNHDPDAIHSHQSGEIHALPEKSTPVAADLVVIEDSENSWAKKKVALSEIGTGGGGGASYAATIGDNTNTSYQVTHGLGTKDLVVQLWDLTGSDPVEATGDADSITVDDEDNITVAFSAPPATDSYRVVVLSDGGTSSGGGGGGASLLLAPHTTPPTTGWSWVNQGSASVTVESTGAQTIATAAVAANNLIGRVRSVTGNFVHKAALGGTSTATHAGFGLAVRESSTGKLTIMYKKSASLVLEHWNSPTSFASSGSVAAAITDGNYLWFQIEDNGTNLIFSVGRDSFNIVQVASMSRTVFLSSGPDEVGVFIRDNNGPIKATLYSWA